MNYVLRGMTLELEKLASEDSENIKRKLLEGGIGAGLAGVIVAPVNYLSDKVGVDSGSRDKTIGKIIKDTWQEGIDEASGALTHERDASNVLRAVRHTPTKKLGLGSKIYHGIKGFYRGQGIKTLKIVPSMALTMALGSIITDKLLGPKKHKETFTPEEIKKIKQITINYH